MGPLLVTDLLFGFLHLGMVVKEPHTPTRQSLIPRSLLPTRVGPLSRFPSHGAEVKETVSFTWVAGFLP